MSDRTSLFARKLRTHRLRAGQHGRMTQEELAEALGVSVDAVGKYERSLSYMRGDLEHRLVEALGWSRAEVVACREDWETRRAAQDPSGYRVIDQTEIIDACGGSAEAVGLALDAIERSQAPDLPSGFGAADASWNRLQAAGLLSGPYVMQGATLVGHAGLIFPVASLERQFHEGRFDEGDLSPDTVQRAILPGAYFGYCPAVYIARGHERVGLLLLTAYADLLADLAEREIVLHTLGAISVSPMGRHLCAQLGLRREGRHAVFPDFTFWSLSGPDIATSLLGRRNPRLRRLYGADMPPV